MVLDKIRTGRRLAIEDVVDIRSYRGIEIDKVLKGRSRDLDPKIPDLRFPFLNLEDMENLIWILMKIHDR